MKNNLISFVILGSALYGGTDPSLEFLGQLWFDSYYSGSDTSGGSDVWGYTTPEGEEYAIMGVYEGVAVIRAIDLEVIDIIPGPQQNDYWFHRDIKTYGHYAYVTNEMYGTNEGLMILDLQYLPDSVRFVGSDFSRYPQSQPFYRCGDWIRLYRRIQWLADPRPCRS